MAKLTKRALLAICLATAAWSFSFGVGSQLTSLSLKTLLVGREDHDEIIGHVQSVYYLGLAVGALAVPWLSKRLGRVCAPLGMIVSGVSLLALAPVPGLSGWFALRLLNGVAGALSLVPLETQVSRNSAPDKRTRHFSYYAVALTLGGALGVWAGLHFYKSGEALPFFLGGLASIAGGIAILCASTNQSEAGQVSERRDKVNWRRDYLCYGTAWFQGFLEGGLLAFLSLYLIALGNSQESAGLLMAITMVGVILFQVPAALLADHFGRLPVLLGCYAIVAVGLGLAPALSSLISLAVCLFVMGACAGALYPLALTILGERLNEARLARAYATFMAMECLGSYLGPIAMGKARSQWGEASMFAVGLAAIVFVLGSWSALTLKRAWRFSTSA